MTLCIAVRNEDNVILMADSRLTIASNSYADVGIKIVSVPCKIFSPRDEKTDKRTCDYEGVFGMCFAGSALSSLVLKESIQELLSPIQHVEHLSDYSMEGIAKFIFDAYKMVTREICKSSIGEKGLAEILIAGLCPKHKEYRAFRFSLNSDNEPAFEEVLSNSGDFELLGSGAEAAKKLLGNQASLCQSAATEVLQAVIADGAIESVGGNIQLGNFKDEVFRCFGVWNTKGTWRAGLNLNNLVDGESHLVPNFPAVDLSPGEDSNEE